MPGWIVSSSNKEIYQRPDREKLLDRNVSTRKVFPDTTFYVQIGQVGNSNLPEVDGLNLRER
jgi:hypothetical protein